MAAARLPLVELVARDARGGQRPPHARHPGPGDERARDGEQAGSWLSCSSSRQSGADAAAIAT